MKLAHGCDDGDDLGLAGCDETIAESLENRVVTGSHQGRHEQHGSHLAATSADEALAA